MQMVFQNAVSVATVSRAQVRRGTFALEPIEALPRLTERISALAERAIETNPFLLPEFLVPAVEGLGERNLRLAIFSDRDELHFFAPVLALGGQVLGTRRSLVWAHRFAPLGTPLIDRETAPVAADALIAHMRASGRRQFALPHLPLNGAAAKALVAAATRGGFSTVAERTTRPILHPHLSRGVGEFDAMVSAKRRRELDRQLRRLCETGAVSFFTARTATEIETAFGMFTTLEASGWKGRRGSAIARRRNIQDFAHSAVTQLAQKGLAAIDVMRVGDRPIAALIRFDHAGTSIPWKVAFDESFAAYSPGKQLMCDETRRWLADPSIERVDPVCEEDNPLMAPLWTEREPYGTLILSSEKWGIGARIHAGLLDLRQRGKAQAKTLLKGSPRRKGGKNGGASRLSALLSALPLPKRGRVNPGAD
jgi:CelD/BcsL family acetyltransferase involved in cellulose biosynthesis